jgi:hypothetical protein
MTVLCEVRNWNLQQSEPLSDIGRQGAVVLEQKIVVTEIAVFKG